MHEHSLILNIISKLDDITRREPHRKVVKIRVRLGALSHFSKDHFEEHFRIASQGGPFEHTELDMIESSDLQDPRAQEVIMESVDLT